MLLSKLLEPRPINNLLELLELVRILVGESAFSKFGLEMLLMFYGDSGLIAVYCVPVGVLSVPLEFITKFCRFYC